MDVLTSGDGPQGALQSMAKCNRSCTARRGEPTIPAMPDLDPAELEAFAAFWAEVDRVEARRAEMLRERKERLLQMRLKGWPVKTLEERLGVSHQLIYNLLNRAGNSTRPRAKRGTVEPEEAAAHDPDRGT